MWHIIFPLLFLSGGPIPLELIDCAWLSLLGQIPLWPSPCFGIISSPSQWWRAPVSMLASMCQHTLFPSLLLGLRSQTTETTWEYLTWPLEVSWQNSAPIPFLGLLHTSGELLSSLPESIWSLQYKIKRENWKFRPTIFSYLIRKKPSSINNTNRIKIQLSKGRLIFCVG